MRCRDVLMRHGRDWGFLRCNLIGYGSGRWAGSNARFPHRSGLIHRESWRSCRGISTFSLYPPWSCRNAASSSHTGYRGRSKIGRFRGVGTSDQSRHRECRNARQVVCCSWRNIQCASPGGLCPKANPNLVRLVWTFSTTRNPLDFSWFHWFRYVRPLVIVLNLGGIICRILWSFPHQTSHRHCLPHKHVRAESVFQQG